jgi:hypothetical protein
MMPPLRGRKWRRPHTHVVLRVELREKMEALMTGMTIGTTSSMTGCFGRVKAAHTIMEEGTATRVFSAATTPAMVAGMATMAISVASMRVRIMTGLQIIGIIQLLLV